MIYINQTILKEKAELRLAQRADWTIPADPQDLIHELKLHQAELEIQNEELRSAQQELSDLHREYEALYESAPCGYLTLNPKGMISRINLAGARLLQADPNTISLYGFSRFIDPGWENEFLSARLASAQKKERQSLELPLKGRLGHTLWVRMDIEADLNPDGAVAQWRLVIFDMSEKQKAQAARDLSNARYKKMMESVTDAVYVCSPRHILEYVNPAMAQRLGRDAAGEVCHEAIHGRPSPCVWCPLEKIRQGQTVEETVKSPLDGQVFRITHIPLANDDGTLSKMSVCRDITEYLRTLEENKKARESLHHVHKMESMGHLAGGIAHDFNNILTSILGFTELALCDSTEGTGIHANMQEVYKAGNRAKDLVKQILTFARQTKDEILPVHLGSIVTESIALLRPLIPSDIEIQHHIRSRSRIMANPTQLLQVVMNLATNASDAMEDTGGRLTLTVSDVSLDASMAKGYGLGEPGDYVRLTVYDTGSGIAPELMKSIFIPYFTTQDPEKGTGLGLSSVQETVKKYKGAIWMESRQKEGTIVTVMLPVCGDEARAETFDPQTLPLGTESILFVDDELSVATVGQQVLERLGYRVTVKNSSTEALALFRSDPQAFDLVITDMTMPHLTGDKLARELMNIRPDLPVILCTGFSRKISEKAAAETGIRAFAHKPVSTPDLARMVRNALNGARTPEKDA